MTGVSHFIAGHKQSKLNRYIIFIALLYFFFSKDLTI